MLLTFATKNYAHWLDLLLRSYRKTNPGRKAKVYILMEKEDFDQYKDDEFFEYHWIPVKESLNMEITKSNKIRSVLRLKTSLILWELILNPGKKFLWVDADSLVLKDVSPFFDKLNHYEFLCTKRPWKPVDQQKLAAGIMGFRSTPAMIQFMTKSSRDVWGHWEGWYSEQLHIYKNLTPDIKTYAFTEQDRSLSKNQDTVFFDHHPNKYYDFERICKEMGVL